MNEERMRWNRRCDRDDRDRCCEDRDRDDRCCRLDDRDRDDRRCREDRDRDDRCCREDRDRDDRSCREDRDQDDRRCPGIVRQEQKHYCEWVCGCDGCGYFDPQCRDRYWPDFTHPRWLSLDRLYSDCRHECGCKDLSC